MAAFGTLVFFGSSVCLIAVLVNINTVTATSCECPDFWDSEDKTHCCGSGFTQYCCDSNEYLDEISVVVNDDYIDEVFTSGYDDYVYSLSSSAIIAIVVGNLVLISSIITLIACCCCTGCYLSNQRVARLQRAPTRLTNTTTVIQQTSSMQPGPAYYPPQPQAQAQAQAQAQYPLQLQYPGAPPSYVQATSPSPPSYSVAAPPYVVPPPEEEPKVV